MNKYTYTDIDKLEKACEEYESSLAEDSFPSDFWSIVYCNRDGGSVPPEHATYADFSVYDFDNRHDFDYLKEMLKKAGLELPSTDAEIDGDGECEWGRRPIYGYSLQLHQPLKSIQLKENGKEEDGSLWAWVNVTLKNGDTSCELFKKNPDASSWYSAEWSNCELLLERFLDDDSIDAVLEEVLTSGVWED